ncbi:hypothetical protein [uncultured Clostridium sp.]|uniref:hypothetical protein n=1 Tax=uncultured Clostridium sp. TaxID=59620 RepID=UPI0028E93047|nr:hypothetical protein [uncultured Clostridium sp.]
MCWPHMMPYHMMHSNPSPHHMMHSSMECDDNDMYRSFLDPAFDDPRGRRRRRGRHIFHHHVHHHFHHMR